MNKSEMTRLLNIRCARTNEWIEPGEIVRIHNWGGSREPIGYGTFHWNYEERAFTFTPHTQLNEAYGLPNASVDDRYDLFRTAPEKLTDEEKSRLSA